MGKEIRRIIISSSGTSVTDSALQAENIVELPFDLFRKILDFADADDRAAIRLVSKHFRNAAEWARHVSIHSPGWFTAKAPFSPAIIATIDTYEKTLAYLHKRDDGQANLARFEAMSEYLSKVACSLTSLHIHSRWLSRNSPVGRVPLNYSEESLSTFMKLVHFHASVRHMPLLRSFKVDGTIDLIALQELQKLGSLKSLEVKKLLDIGVVEEMCNKLSLSRLDLGIEKPEEWEGGHLGNGSAPASLMGPADYQRIIEALSPESFAGLCNLSLPCPAAAIQYITALRGLTALKIRMWDASGSIDELSALKSLEILKVVGLDFIGVEERRFESLQPLATLSKLTFLHVDSKTEGTSISESELTILSKLTALRDLRYGEIINLSCVYNDGTDADSLPVHLRFLSSATSLTRLLLEFHGATWDLSSSQTNAIRAAVSELPFLLDVSVWLSHAWHGNMESFFTPLSLFKDAAQLHFLRYGLDDDSDVDDSTCLAQECLTAMTQLRVLQIGTESFLGGQVVWVPMPNCVELLINRDQLLHEWSSIKAAHDIGAKRGHIMRCHPTRYPVQCP